MSPPSYPMIERSLSEAQRPDHPPQRWFSLLRLALLWLLGIFGISILSACSAGCKRADEAWRAVARSTPDPAGPHWRLEVDRRAVDEALNAMISELPSAPWRPKSPLQGLKLPKLKFKPEGPRWEMSERDEATLTLTVELYAERQALLSLSLTGRSPVRLDRARGALRVKVSADQFKRASLRLGRGSKRALKSALQSWLPSSLKALTPASELTRVADALLKKLSTAGYDVLRARLLKRVGALAELEWPLPDLPLKGARLSLTRHVWRLELDSSIQGASLSAGARSKVAIKGAQLWISAPWLAEVAQWGMERGELPSAFSLRGAPQEDGPARARLSWETRQAERPLKVHLWASRAHGAPVCLYAQVGVHPKLDLSTKGSLAFQATGELERVEGHPFAELASELTGLAERQLSWHTKASLPSSINSPAGSLSLRWREASFQGPSLRVGLTLIPLATQGSRKRVKKRVKKRRTRSSRGGS